MKRIGWLISIGLLLVVIFVCFYRYSTNISKDRTIGSAVDTAKVNISKRESDEKVAMNDSFPRHNISPNSTEKAAVIPVKHVNAPTKRSSDTLNLRDFGVLGNGKNETIGFQKAIDASVGKVLFIPKQQGAYYLTRQLLIPSNSKFIFDSRAIIQATDDLKQDHADFEVLFRIEGANDVYFQGNNALFRMNKSAYSGEHNHIFMINGASNVTINGVRANDSGGDGVYIGAYKSNRKYCENINIINIIANNNRRQGLSVITVKNLLVRNSQFNNTSGASPASGVDIEPNNSGDFLQNIRFENCSANNNQRRGFMVQLSKVTKDNNKIDITFDNCIAKGNIYGFASMYFDDNATGLIQFLNCQASASKYAGFVEESCSSTGVAKRYSKCIASNNNTSGSNSESSNSSNFYIYDSGKKKRSSIGNSSFENCVSINENGKISNGISVMATRSAAPKKIQVSGFTIQGNHKSKILVPKRETQLNNILIK